MPTKPEKESIIWQAKNGRLHGKMTIRINTNINGREVPWVKLELYPQKNGGLHVLKTRLRPPFKVVMAPQDPIVEGPK